MDSHDTPIRPLYTLIAAGLLLALYVAASWYLIDRFAEVVYNGIASIGFSAAGVLLGTSVQQVNLSAARQDAARAKDDAAAKAAAMRKAVDTLAGDQPASAAAVGAPADVGGRQAAPERVATARQMLLEALR